MVDDIIALFISADTTIEEAIRCINNSEIGIALVVDDARHLVGTVVDGDIRRAMLDHIAISETVSVLLERKPEQYRVPVSAPVGTSRHDLKVLMTERSVRHVPLVNAEGAVVEIFHYLDVIETIDSLGDELEAVVMAGGFGTRLRPLTNDIPKPMLEVGDYPLLYYIMQQLRQSGIRKLNITTHYMPEKIIDYFGDGSDYGMDINYIHEETPLGTAGGLSLVPNNNKAMLIMNGDLLTKVGFRNMFKFHRECGAQMTVAIRSYHFDVPYGVLKVRDHVVQELVEKPHYEFFVNAGIYIIESDVHKGLQRDQYLDMTDLMGRLIANGQTVCSFPIHEYWLDIGQMEQYQQAKRDMLSGKTGF